MPDRYRVEPGSRVRLSDWDPQDTRGLPGGKQAAEPELERLTERLEELQELLYAEHKHRLLVILQAMDTGGKDGTIRHVFEGVNPQGVKVTAFGVPTPQELAHDYLWRVHPHTPGLGEIMIFNRSHYEDVLIVRVHNLVPAEVWQRRYAHINDFERMLADEGVTILKFYLHISKEEQRRRLQERLDDPRKQWKFRIGDLQERARWDEYMAAYEDVLSLTSTAWAPWYIVPADHKWYRNWVVASVIVQTLSDFKMSYPPAEQGLEQIRIT
jgi:PPK2 family polyphosphate:nucleotide phosphotransferase